jgi:hypothetical protein
MAVASLLFGNLQLTSDIGQPPARKSPQRSRRRHDPDQRRFARQPKKLAHGKTAFHHRRGRDCDYRSQRGCTRLHWVFHLGRTLKAGCAETDATPPRAPGAPHRSPGFAVARGVVLRVVQLAQGAARVDIYQSSVPFLSSTIQSRLAHLTLVQVSEGIRIFFWENDL